MKLIKRALTSMVVILFVLHPLLSFSSATGEFRFSPNPNRANLINWHHWGREAFDEARREDKLVLLSLSAIWCHWCHVMDETTYSNTEIIEFINKNYIPIRVDADREPQIDEIYNQGGWPSTVILTPEGEILNGGTYIPPERMLEMLKETLSFYKNNKEQIKKRIDSLKSLKKEQPMGIEDMEDDYVAVGAILKDLEENFDSRYGGFDIGQKFPRPEVLEFLMLYYLDKPERSVKKMIIQSLNAMAMTRLHDHVEGGFFRYSVKRDWSRPHFEKMLDVNAGLMKDYAIAGSLFKRKEFFDTARDVYNYLLGHLYDKENGLFYGSQDADEVYYNSRSRKGLKPPAVDRTIYADRNGLVLSALSCYGALTGRRDVIGLAIRAGRALIEHFYKKTEGIYHYMTVGSKKARLSGLLKDNVLVATGLLDLYEVTGEKIFLDTSMAIAGFTEKHFLQDGLLKTALRKPVVSPVTQGLMQKYSLIKSNYRALILFNRLMFYDQRFKKTALTLRKGLSGTYKRFYFTSALFGEALEYSMHRPFQIEIITSKKDLDEFLDAVNSVFMPFKVIRVYLLKKDSLKIKQKGYPEEESIYVCRGKRCFKPIKPSKDMKKHVSMILSYKRGPDHQ